MDLHTRLVHKLAYLVKLLDKQTKAEVATSENGANCF